LFFACLVYYCEFIIFILIFFLYYQLYHHYVHIPTLTPFTLPPSYALKSIALLPNYYFCPFSSTLSPCPCLPSHLPQPINRLPLPPTLSPPADQPTIPTLHNPNPMQTLTQAAYTTTTEIHPNTHKLPQNPAAPTLLPPLTHTTSCLLF
jgi:hypothetical protein